MSRWMVECHPRLRRGDAFLHNSPYHGNSHAADHTILVPVIDDDGVHRFTVFAKAHQADIGNSQPTSYTGAARDVYEEGALIFPAVQVQRDYRDIDDIVRMCRLRIRVPDQWWGDYQALVGAARIGERELLALGARSRLGCARPPRPRLVRLLRAAHGRPRSAACRAAGSRARASTTRSRARRRRASPSRSPSPSMPRPAAIEVDLRDNPDCLPNGMNVTEANASSAVMIGIFSSLGEVGAAQRRQLSADHRPSARELLRRHSPPSGVLLALDHQSRLEGRQCHADRHRRARRRLRSRRIRHHRAGLDGGDLRPRPALRQRAVHQFALPDAYRRSRRARGRRLAHHRAYRRPRPLLSRQRRARRAALSDPRARPRHPSRTAKAPAASRRARAAFANTARSTPPSRPGSPATAPSMPPLGIRGGQRRRPLGPVQARPRRPPRPRSRPAAASCWSPARPSSPAAAAAAATATHTPATRSGCARTSRRAGSRPGGHALSTARNRRRQRRGIPPPRSAGGGPCEAWWRGRGTERMIIRAQTH